MNTAIMNISDQERNWVLAVVLTSYLMIVLDISIVITGLPDIQRGLGFSPVALSWVQNAYLLCFGGFLLLAARAGDLFGRKRMLLTGLALFTAASFAVGLAQTSAWLIGARAIQGIGAAIIAPSVLALRVDLLSHRISMALTGAGLMLSLSLIISLLIVLPAERAAQRP